MRAALLAAVLLLACCQRSTPPPGGPGPAAALPEAPALTGAVDTIYVPAWSSVFTPDQRTTFDLTVTLGVRNLDLTRPVTLTGVRYYGADGQLQHTYLAQPRTLAPLASMAVVVHEADTRAGVGGSFLVDWSAPPEVTPPLAEAVMIGTRNQQGISFVTEGRPLPRGAGR